jgi:uncharacterized protein YdhG (YjbR/CyaY superfamily)
MWTGGSMSPSSPKSDPKAAAGNVQAYFDKLPPVSRKVLRQLRATVRAAAPGTVEGISYGIPGLKLEGQPVVWYAAWKNHVSLYPMIGTIKSELGAALDKYEMSKGTIRFPLDAPLPLTLVRRIVKLRMADARARARAKKKR